VSFAGVAQLQERDGKPARKAVPPIEVAGANPAPRSTILQALVAGLQHDQAAFEAGYRDGAARAARNPRQFDPYSYASGYLRGQRGG